MLLSRIVKTMGVTGAASFALLACCPMGYGGVLEALGFHCPPPYKHCQEGPPRLCFKTVCPRPVCGPCDLKHFGYFQNCWMPYPYAPDWSHCPVPQAVIDNVVPVVPGTSAPTVRLPPMERAPGQPQSNNLLSSPQATAPLTRWPDDPTRKAP
jgi:hypothetical protein